MDDPTEVGSTDLATRLASQAATWGMSVDRTVVTASSLLAYGRRGGQPVVLKVVRAAEERGFGALLARFGGHGTVRALAHSPGAALLERIEPGTPLATLSLSGEDEEAARILADVIAAMQEANAPADGVPNVARWRAAFSAYREGGDTRFPGDLVREAADRYAALCATQGRIRLLHGDLHHHNVLRDSRRGWLAIDPKGVAGELEYELGAALRNPAEAADRFATPKVIERRIQRFEARLPVDVGRVREWAFSQAVLAAIWEVEDDLAPDTTSPFLRVARALRQGLG